MFNIVGKLTGTILPEEG